MAIITDEQILSAWGGGPRSADAATHVAWLLRRALESDYVGQYAVPVDGFFRFGDPKCDIAALRDRLGGWDAVWRSVLEELGFPCWEGLQTSWRMPDEHELFGLYVRRLGDDYELHVLSRWVIPLASPADLRERVGHLRKALGTKETDHA